MKELQFECSFCKNQHCKKVVTTFDHYSQTKTSIDIVECLNCGVSSLYPLPDQESHFSAYPTDTINPLLISNSSGMKFIEILYRFFHPYSVKWRRKRIQKEIGVGQLLDVGCRNGDFLQEMRRQLWNVVGIEQNPIQHNFASKTLGLTVYQDLSQLKGKHDKQFDVITFWHSLGHFLNPEKALYEALQLLRKDGCLVIALPNLLSMDFWIYKKYWVALDAPRRLFHISPISIKKFIKRNGLKLVRRKVIPFDIYYNCLLSEKLLIENNSTKKTIKILYYFRAIFFAINLHILSFSGTGSGMLYVLKQDFSTKKL